MKSSLAQSFERCGLTTTTMMQAAHKGLKTPKRFINLPLVSMSSILNLMGLMHSYRSSRVPWTPRSYNVLIEVFEFIWDVETPITSEPYLSRSHQDWGLWTVSSKVAECAARRRRRQVRPDCKIAMRSMYTRIIFCLVLHINSQYVPRAIYYS